MTLKQAIKFIVKNWERLHDTFQGSGYGEPKTVAVWVAESYTSRDYDIDLEKIGITPQGNIAWAYASGCSCWDGDYTENTKPTIKEFTLDHGHLPEEWEAAIIRFAETEIVQQLV
jgi:hypothetical protein